jgi:hypothetical protein
VTRVLQGSCLTPSVERRRVSSLLVNSGWTTEGPSWKVAGAGGASVFHLGFHPPGGAQLADPLRNRAFDQVYVWTARMAARQRATVSSVASNCFRSNRLGKRVLELDHDHGQVWLVMG